MDENFSRGDNPEIDLWRVYNLFTGANKSSYIDTFLDRSLNATELITVSAKPSRAMQNTSGLWSNAMHLTEKNTLAVSRRQEYSFLWKNKANMYL